MWRALRLAVGGAALGVLAGCASLPASKDDITGTSSPQAQTQGWVLLKTFLNDERRLQQVFLLQDASQPIEQLIVAVSERCDKAYDELPGLAKLSPTVNLEASDGLPEAETQTRMAVEATSTVELLETEGTAFERTLLLTQTEGLSYGYHLCDVLAKGEANAKRKQWLTQLGTDLKKLHERVTMKLKVR